jgi:FAD/FMN-containing dehydrogenase
MTNISVNATTGIATIQTGNRLGDVALALNNAGRALPHGTCPYVGIGGHSGHGGFGFTSRMWGLALDTIVRATVILANGTILTTSESQHNDLFWVSLCNNNFECSLSTGNSWVFELLRNCQLYSSENIPYSLLR